jgi:outer membrane protein
MSRTSKTEIRCLGALLGAVSLTGLSVAGHAADLPTSKPAPALPAPAPPPPLGFFVKLGFTYGINTSSSKLYSQQVPIPGAPQFQIPGVGASVGNVATLGVEAGYFFTPNISVDVSGGIPVFAAVKTQGQFPPGLLPVPDGTRLSSVMPSFIPVTLLYHFNQWGQFQPYLGGGLAPVFSFGEKSGFNTGVSVNPALGFVLQGGADFMFDNHWGWSFDVKKLFANTTAHFTGLNLAEIGLAGNVPVAGTLKTNYQPWVLSTGVTYRF